jgi:hypothetical protein
MSEEVIVRKQTRPYGVTITLILAILMYGIMPIMLDLGPLILSTLSGRSFSVNYEGGTAPGLMTAFGVAVIIASVVALTGRPPWIRWAVLGIIWLETAVMLIRTIGSLNAQPITPGGQVGGTFTPQPSSVILQLVLLIIIPVYLTWYLHRAPARAFFNERASQ